MRKSVLLPVLLLLGSAASSPAAQRVSVHELEQVLSQSQNLSDADLALKLSDLQLTERLSTDALAQWRAKLAGPRAQRALTALADRSAFLAEPAGDIPPQAAPDLAQQREIMGKFATYVSRAVPQLPHFYASRTITHYEAAPSDTIRLDEADLHAVRISRSIVQYRDGEEVVQPGIVKASDTAGPDQGLRTWGVFGPILSLVLLDAAQNQLAWSHWEQGPEGPVAVFRYAVLPSRSHYEVRYCCQVANYGMETTTFHQMSGYHGEIAVDPATGSVVRLLLDADLQATDPISRAAIVVEYRQVELGGLPYICPARSISVSVASTIRDVKGPGGHGFFAMGPPQVLLNDTEFSQYHLFRGETRILSASEEKTAGTAPDITLSTADRAPEAVLPAEESHADAPAAPAGSPAASGATAESALVAGDSDAAEITATKTTSLPDSPARPSDAQLQPPGSQTPDSGFRLQLNARLVDVNVVALDKKGRPISDLKQQDFEIYDNGVKQDVRSFNRADSEAADAPAPAEAPGKPQGSPVFSNRPGTAAQPAASPSAAGSGSSETANTFVYLFDPGNMVYNDFVDARRQVIQFLKKAPEGQRAALYVMRYHRYQVLSEATSDHAALIAILSKWMPSAQDLLNARDEEDRNRQHIETVHNLEDMLSVNGNVMLDPMTQGEAQDPKLREMGSNASGTSLDLLVSVAAHLAPIPGHKSVVWVTSDNALADWNRMSVSIEKHAKYVEPAALRAQEALNNAHASIYPLDASRLEANVITADLGNRNVQLTSTYPNPTGGPPQLLDLQTKQLGPEASAGGSTDADPQHPYAMERNMTSNNRLYSQMQQDMRPIEGVFREVAEATGGHAFRRSSNIEGELDSVVAESNATYLIGFTPGAPADGQYHRLTVKLVGHAGATVRYRTGYQYDKEPTTLKARFAQAMLQPNDSSEIAISARPVTDSAGQALRVTIAGTDLDLAQQNAQPAAAAGAAAAGSTKTPEAVQPSMAKVREFWSGKLDIFLIQRNDTAQTAHVTGQTVGLRLKPGTYQHAVADGLTFDERVKPGTDVNSLRVVVVDVNSGRIGSVTVPTSAFAAAAPQTAPQTN